MSPMLNELIDACTQFASGILKTASDDGSVLVLEYTVDTREAGMELLDVLERTFKESEHAYDTADAELVVCSDSTGVPYILFQVWKMR